MDPQLTPSQLHALADLRFLREVVKVGFADKTHLRALVKRDIFPLYADDPHTPGQVIVYGYIDLNTKQAVTHRGWEAHALD
jgi:hypothetical protein